MTVLRRARIEVEPDLSGFDASLREQFARAKPGDKIGKQLGGQLNRSLAKLDLDPISIKADPKAALTAVGITEERLRKLSREAPTVEVRVQTEQALTQLGQFRKKLGDVGGDDGDKVATGFVSRFASRVGPLMASVPLSPHILAAAAPAIPLLGAAISGAVVGSAAAGGIIGGVALAARRPEVKNAGQELGQFILGDLERRSAGFTQPVLNGISRIRAGWADMGDDLDRVFASSRFVEPLVERALSGAKQFVSGFADAVEASDPVVTSLGVLIEQVGVSAGGVFTQMAQDAGEGAAAIDDMTLAITDLITVTGALIHGAATIRGYGDAIDKVADQTRYWLEDNNLLFGGLVGVNDQIDLTADGFAHGSAAAEAYRKATLGSAQASDFATLKAAGMTDAQIQQADASGKYAVQLQRQRAAQDAVAVSADQMVATEDRVTEAQKASSLAQEDYNRTLDQLAPKAGLATQLTDGLRKAAQNMYGAARAGADANEAYEASWDALSDSVLGNRKTIEDNNRSLNIHSAAGRANRDVLKGLVSANNEVYYANIAAGDSVESARKKHEARTAAIKVEAQRLGLNKKATQELINTYGKIPPKKTTDIVLDKLGTVVNALKELYIFQRSLAEGIPIASARAAANEKAGPAKRYGGFAQGGYTGDGGKYEPKGVVHGGEWVFDKETTSKVRRQAPGFLEEVHATGQLPGYAGGGLVAPVETRGLRYRLDMSKTDIPSRKEVSAKVMPAFGHWPPSPSAQRGDSGVWRSIVALINSTGPISGSFGNAYRPGDPLWHGSGRAVDWMGYDQDRLATFLAGKRPLELIHRTRNRDYAYTRGVNKGSFNNSLMQAHRNHVHIAMAGGGTIDEPVFGVGRSGRSYSFGERGPETVTPGTGGTVHIHFHNSVITSRQAAEDLVVDAVRSARKNRRLT